MSLTSGFSCVRAVTAPLSLREERAFANAAEASRPSGRMPTGFIFRGVCEKTAAHSPLLHGYGYDYKLGLHRSPTSLPLV